MPENFRVIGNIPNSFCGIYSLRANRKLISVLHSLDCGSQPWQIIRAFHFLRFQKQCIVKHKLIGGLSFSKTSNMRIISPVEMEWNGME